MSSRVKHKHLARCLFLATVSSSSLAQVAPPEPPTGWFDRALGRIDQIASKGEWDVLVSGYAMHDDDNYSAKRRAKLNNNAWGGGIGKTLRNDHGNDESIYAAAFLDSNRRVQWSMGVSHQWVFPVAGTGVEASAGLTALVIRRHDWFDGMPFPAILPIFAVGTQRYKLNGMYVPHMSTKKGKGDVLLLFFKLSL